MHEVLLAEGMARVLAVGRNRAGLQELRAVERQARRERRGLPADPPPGRAWASRSDHRASRVRVVPFIGDQERLGCAAMRLLGPGGPPLDVRRQP